MLSLWLLSWFVVVACTIDIVVVVVVVAVRVVIGCDIVCAVGGVGVADSMTAVVAVCYYVVVAIVGVVVVTGDVDVDGVVGVVV